MLHAEQYGLCAYSEIMLDSGDFGMHLDHVEPKSKKPLSKKTERQSVLSH